jgi:hypothetical protein
VKKCVGLSGIGNSGRYGFFMVITFGGLGALGGGRVSVMAAAAAAAAIAWHRVYGLVIEERSCKPLCCKVLLCCMEFWDGKAQLWLEQLITQLLRHLRERRVAKANQLRAVVFKYVSSIGGLRAFPSSLNGDVYVPFHFNFETTPNCWVEENFRLPRQDIDRVRALLGIPEVVHNHNRDCIPAITSHARNCLHFLSSASINLMTSLLAFHDPALALLPTRHWR